MSKPLCSACREREVWAKGMCLRCYKRARRPSRDTSGKPARVIGEPSGMGRYGILEVDDEAVRCHECGGWFETLGGHTLRVHEMTAAQYKAEHGLPRTAALMAGRLVEAHREASAARVGTPAWQRLEAARDPVAASHSRDAEALRGGAAVAEARLERAIANAPLGRAEIHLCPICLQGYTGRDKTCGRPECQREARARATWRVQTEKYPRLTEKDRAALKAATGEGLDDLVRALQAAGVPSRDIGAELGRSPAWMSTHYPRP